MKVTMMKRSESNPGSANSEQEHKTRLLMFGTFDILHPGHLKIFKDAACMADEVYVVVARDKTVEEVKKRKTVYPEQERLAHVAAAPHVTKALLGSLSDRYAVLDIIKPDIIALGYDQQFFIDKLEEELKKRGLKTRIVKLQAHMPHLYKSTRFRKQMGR